MYLRVLEYGSGDGVAGESYTESVNIDSEGVLVWTREFSEGRFEDEYFATFDWDRWDAIVAAVEAHRQEVRG